MLENRINRIVQKETLFVEMTLNITPKKFGLSRDPPKLVLYYVLNESGKIHRRSIPVRKLDEFTNVDDMYNALTKAGSHGRYLEKVPRKQVTRCLRMLLGKETEDELKKNNNVSSEKDLNKLDDGELNAVKVTMDKSFEKSRIKPGDNDWQYDVEENFDQGMKIESGWDDDDQSDLEF